MRLLFLVDALNLYYGVRSASPKRRTLLWLDLHKLCKVIGERMSPGASQIEVNYFTAIPLHLAQKDAAKIQRHRDFIAALKATGVQISQQSFSQKSGNTYAKIKGSEELSWVEKGTDVAIISALFEKAHHDTFDHAVIMSNDADYLPAIDTLRRMYPNKSVTFALTPAKGMVNRRLKAVPKAYHVTSTDYADCQLPEAVRVSRRRTITRPPAWQ
jgi:uncharacterized LabA/DUF88 family protein